MPQALTVILPDTGQGLLRQEITLALQSLGISVHRVHPNRLHVDNDELSLGAFLEKGQCVLLSINMMGLERLDDTLAFLEKKKGRAVVWFIDNPWNVLAGVKSRAWKKLPICVTDSFFVEALKKNGAEKVFFLPLAVCPTSMLPNKRRDEAFPEPENLAPIVFVGRSAFPGKDVFFSGIPFNSTLASRARNLLALGVRPDLGWWEEALGLSPEHFWPGKKNRISALGAEHTSLLWRSLCLAEFADYGKELTDSHSAGLDIFGDEGWAGIMPKGAVLKKPVDYYAHLPGIYRKAQYSVCLTSMQLPKGLNQRHFDIWFAGGFCVTDAAGGLGLFPKELTEHITFTSVQNIAGTVSFFEQNSYIRKPLQEAWKEVLLSEHTYVHRMGTLFSYLGMD